MFYRLAVKTVNRFYQFKKNRYMQRLQKNGLHIGENVTIVSEFFFDPSHCYLIHIGDNSVICPNVRLIAHDASSKPIIGYTKLGKIEIQDRCFIGDSAIVLPNVTIGHGSIVGAGSVVTKDIPPESIAVGNPAKVISNISDYGRKLEKKTAGKKLFGKDYFIENLNDEKRKELVNEAGEGIGFIR